MRAVYKARPRLRRATLMYRVTKALIPIALKLLEVVVGTYRKAWNS